MNPYLLACSCSMEINVQHMAATADSVNLIYKTLKPHDGCAGIETLWNKVAILNNGLILRDRAQ